MKPKDPHWQANVDSTRKGVVGALQAIQRGTVDEYELEKLHNFCLFSLALMQAEGPVRWARAKLNAELMSLMREKK